MERVVGVTKEIYLLFKALEDLESDLHFTCFYSFAKSLESHLFCPGFYHDNSYYEIQYDDKNCYKVVDFGIRGIKLEGDVMTGEEIVELTKNLKDELDRKL